MYTCIHACVFGIHEHLHICMYVYISSILTFWLLRPNTPHLQFKGGDLYFSMVHSIASCSKAETSQWRELVKESYLVHGSRKGTAEKQRQRGRCRRLRAGMWTRRSGLHNPLRHMKKCALLFPQINPKSIKSTVKLNCHTVPHRHFILRDCNC